MPKIMIVEDDSSLREIYGIRLTAEGYDVVSAGDGEEALANVVREKPNLIISDVMMPKISGFDMLDILRQTPETKNVKVIMMTALSSEEQRTRGESLGANKYLVKSQVGIEDVVNAVHEVLGDKPGSVDGASNQATNETQVDAGQGMTAMANAPATTVPQPASNISQPINNAPTINTQGVVPSAQPEPLPTATTNPIQSTANGPVYPAQ